ncbi:MAG TPA: serine/threonine-protein kinase [Kofleriaceae bacterium]|nr:serine/threonine-protein kinase [Kofleriaceae bacterium]
MTRVRTLGRYELWIELARGGMAELFLARLHGAGGFAKLVAIKRILPALARDPAFVQMFLDEGRIASRLSHPNICQVFELGEERGELFLAMEYLEGAPWADLAAAGERDLRLVVSVLAQAAEGLHHAHALRDLTGRPTPVVHRDVSPQNLFVTVDGVCKVLDFGVSKMTTDGPRTREGVIKGKLPYMAPEQIAGAPIDARTDVFALGVCAWEALAGTRLYDRESDYAIWQAITEHDAPFVTTRWPACPPALAAMIARALARDPAHRVPTAQAFADELRRTAGVVPYTASELARIVHARCGAQIAERARRVAAVATEPVAPSEIATDVGPRDAIPTLDLKPSAPVKLRDRSQPVLREPARKASHVRSALIAALAAATVTAIVVIVLVRRETTPTPARDAGAATPPDAKPGFGSIVDLRRDLETLRHDLKPLQDLGKAVRGEGTYRLDSVPAAEIFVDGTAAGTTPIDVELAAGSHRVRAVLEDGRAQTFTIVIDAGQTLEGKRLAW